MTGAEELARAAVDARREFDDSFAAPPRAEATGVIAALRISILPGRDALVRLGALESVQPSREVVWVPGAEGALLGVASDRGEVVPVFHLGRLLGLGDGPAPAFLRARSPAPIAFGASALHGRVDLAEASLAPGDPRTFVQGVATVAGTAIPLLDIPGLIASAAALVRRREKGMTT